MAVPIIICDDSNMARKQMNRCLPKDWAVDVTFVENGEEAVNALKKGLGEVLFLDLTMPVMDGYETLEAIRQQALDTMVIVVSGDVQDEAYKRVMAMGAMEFIQKPASIETVSEILERFGIHRILESSVVEPSHIMVVDDVNATSTDEPELTSQSARFDAYQEITNIAVGRAAKLLAKLTGEFVNLPIPRVNLLEGSELQMALAFSRHENVSAVSQGFIAPGISGEALLIFGDGDLGPMAEILGHSDGGKIEVLTDIAGVMLGAILKGLGEQLHLTFSQSYPSVIGASYETETSVMANTLAIEVSCVIPAKNIHCDVLLLFTEASLATIDERLV